MTVLLKVRSLGKKLGENTIFEGVDFDLAPGEPLAVLGVSGCGKSTLLRLIAGLDTPTAGVIERSPGLRMGMVFQDLALWPNLNVLQNVTLGLGHLDRASRKRDALAALETCHITDLASRKPSTLSLGQQQRVALARAVAVRPDLLLLDEPFSNLDLLLREELMAEVRRVVGRLGAALVLVTHDPFEAVALARHALVLEDGKPAESGELATLLAAPRSRLLRHFAVQLDQIDSQAKDPT